MDFWSSTDHLPFVGNIIYWDPKPMRKRQITLDLTDYEFMELFALSACSDFNGQFAQLVDPPPMLQLMKNIETLCESWASEEEREQIKTCVAACKKVYSEPSIERGMLMGGLEGLNEKFVDELKK